MNDRDEYYEIITALRNIQMIKLAHDYDLDVTNLGLQIYAGMGFDNNFDNFFTIIEQLFTEACFYNGYDDMDDCQYWLSQVHGATMQDLCESSSIFVLLDDDIPHFQCTGFGGNYDLIGLYSGYGEIYPIERGMVLIYNEDDGAIDWVEVLFLIFEYLKEFKDERKEKNNEIAV